MARKNRLRGSVLAVVSATLAGTATAQQSSGGLEEIVVTARKREQSVQEVPLSISAFDESSYRDLTRGTLDGLAAQVTNLQAYATNSFLQSVHIRGIGLNEFQGQYDSPVAQHIDEVYFSKALDDRAPPVRHRASRGTQGAAGHPVRPQHDRRRAQLLHPGAVAGLRCRLRARLRRARTLQARRHAERWAHRQAEWTGRLQHRVRRRRSRRTTCSRRTSTASPTCTTCGRNCSGKETSSSFARWLTAAGTRARKWLGRVRVSSISAHPVTVPQTLTGRDSTAIHPPAPSSRVSRQLQGHPEGEFEPDDAFTINQNTPPEVDDTFYGGYLRIDYDMGWSQLTSITGCGVLRAHPPRGQPERHLRLDEHALLQRDEPVHAGAAAVRGHRGSLAI